MINSIVVFYGSSRDFDEILQNEVTSLEDAITLIEVIQHYNARIRPSEAAVKESDLARKLTAEVCIVRTDDYGSILDHAIANFVTIITRNYDIGTLYVQNPPKRVFRSLYSAYPERIDIRNSKYITITREVLKTVYNGLCSDVLGQVSCKKQIMGGLYKATVAKRQQPIVLMLYGPSGVGKTETAKSISKSLGGDLLRIQFSMMQTTEAFDYIFGAEHSKGSFARDMLARESNVILIDEFDKVSPRFYNAFYELFDEGHFSDINYELDLPNAVFLLTCNFMTEHEIKTTLGAAMFSRIGAFIKYEDISKEHKVAIISKWYDSILKSLHEDEKAIIHGTNILSWFIDNVSHYDNIRILKTKMENAVFNKLTETFVIAPTEEAQRVIPKKLSN